MTPNTTPDGVGGTVEECVDVLQSFELTEYESKCFVALSRIGHGTAKEVSEVADIPQARVYDCMDALADRGLVDVQQSKPRRFRAATTREALRTLDQYYSRRLERLDTLFDRLESPEREVRRATSGSSRAPRKSAAASGS
ncbi:TrmB family transcriptional regulator [Halapricum sp. CBA1109]|uniref:TrmB family transcriptional regulator n=1 Tax=Halapricum sp. CBA1109 TaxID=2668068 RepID=UPI001E366F56|nr:helix-turn-helix domain-containing protein [Halapricum sp. CBA1109]